MMQYEMVKKMCNLHNICSTHDALGVHAIHGEGVLVGACGASGYATLCLRGWCGYY